MVAKKLSYSKTTRFVSKKPKSKLVNSKPIGKITRMKSVVRINPTRTFHQRKEVGEKWEVWSIDCWGNARDGYDMNDRSECGYIMLPKEFSDRQVLEALKEYGYLKKTLKMSSIEIDGDDTIMYINAPDGYMYYQLVKEE